MSEDTYKGLTAEQWHNAYQDLKRKTDRLQYEKDFYDNLAANMVKSVDEQIIQDIMDELIDLNNV
jgi:hypothetical protein